jgi:hypothetical protein
MRAAVILVLAACSSNDDIPAPQIAGVVPDHGLAGTIVTVDGSYLCQEPPPTPDDPMFPCNTDGVITFDQTPANATSAWTDTGVMVQVPDGATGTVQVTASMTGRTSNGVSFTVD